jgi:hypothetical protein
MVHPLCASKPDNMSFQLTAANPWNSFQTPPPSREVNNGVQHEFLHAADAYETDMRMASTIKGKVHDQTANDPMFDIGGSGLSTLSEGLLGNYFRSIQPQDKTLGQQLSKTLITSTLGGAAGRQDRKDKLEAVFIQHARKILSLDKTADCTRINRTGIAFDKKWYLWVHKKEAEDLPWMLPFRQWTQEQQNAAVDCMEWNVIGLEIVRGMLLYVFFSGLMKINIGWRPHIRLP